MRIGVVSASPFDVQLTTSQHRRRDAGELQEAVKGFKSVPHKLSCDDIELKLSIPFTGTVPTASWKKPLRDGDKKEPSCSVRLRSLPLPLKQLALTFRRQTITTRSCVVSTLRLTLQE